MEGGDPVEFEQEPLDSPFGQQKKQCKKVVFEDVSETAKNMILNLVLNLNTLRDVQLNNII